MPAERVAPADERLDLLGHLAERERRDDAAQAFVHERSFKLGGTLALGARVVPWVTETSTGGSAVASVDIVVLFGVDFGF